MMVAMPSYDASTALIVVDVQNDFADPGGSLYVNEGEKVVAPINEEIRKAQQAGALVVYTQDWHPPSTPHFEKDGGVWPVHCVQGTWGADLHPDLEVIGEVVQKGTGGEDGYSGFTVRDPETGEISDTRLEALLRERHVTKAVVVGLATDYCVKETAMDAAEKGFKTVVVSEMIRPVNLEPEDGERALQEMRDAGAQVA